MKDMHWCRTPARLSVGMFTYSNEPRGSVVHAAALAEALVRRGCDVSLYALNKGDIGFYRDVACELKLVPAAAAGKGGEALVRQRIAELALYLQERDVVHDVVHAQDCLTTNALQQCSNRTLGRVFRTVHHIEQFACPYLDACQTRSILEANALCAVSQSTSKQVWERFGRHAAVVGNGVDANRLRAISPHDVVDARERILHGRSGPLLLSVGGIEPRKNSLATLEAFALFKQVYPNAVWAIVGGATALDHSDYGRRFEIAKQTFGHSGDVISVGVLDDRGLGALLGAADALLNASMQEGFGLTVLEALAAGLPVVASNAAPFVEYLNQASAVLVDCTSPQSIARGAMEAVRTSTRRQLAGRKVASAHAWETVAARTHAAYLKVAAISPEHHSKEVMSHA